MHYPHEKYINPYFFFDLTAVSQQYSCTVHILRAEQGLDHIWLISQNLSDTAILFSFFCKETETFLDNNGVPHPSRQELLSTQIKSQTTE